MVEGFLAMVLFLVCYVSGNAIDVRMRNREGPITASLLEFSPQESILVYPARRPSFEQLHDFLNGFACGQIVQGMD